MSRIARVVAVGLPHHITQRGNFQQDVFRHNSDREKYLSWIQEYSAKYALSILAYCLMQNHVHFITIPHKQDSLAKTFSSTHMRYSHYYNKKMKRAGHLWQNRFFSCILDESHLIAAAKYIELNPIRKNLVKKPWEWKWSSASFHINGGRPSIRLKDLFGLIDMSHSSWKEHIDAGQDEKTVNKIRRHTLAGYPLGTPSFVEKLEKKFGRKFQFGPKGRPKYKHDNK